MWGLGGGGGGLWRGGPRRRTSWRPGRRSRMPWPLILGRGRRVGNRRLGGFAQVGGGLLGPGVVDERARAELDAGEKLQPVAAPVRRGGIQGRGGRRPGRASPPGRVD